MAVNVEIVQFALPRGVATTTLDITKAGFGTPKVAIFIVNNNIGVDDASMTNGKKVMQSMGATDGTRQYANCASSIDNQTVDYSTSYMDAASVVIFYNNTTRRGEWKSNGWVTDGVQIEVVQQIAADTDMDGNDPLCTCILMSGDDLQVYVGGFQANGNSTPKVITAPGFLANALFAFGNLRSKLNQVNTVTSTYSNAWILNDGNATTYNASWQGKRLSNNCDRRSSIYDTDIVIGQYFSSSTKTDLRINAFSATGFTVTNLGPQFAQAGMGYVAFKFSGGYGIDAKVIDFPNSGDHVVSGLNVTPEFGMIFADAGVPAKNTVYASGTYLSGTGIVAFDDTNIFAQCERRDDGGGTMFYDTQSASSLKVLNGNGGTAYLSTAWTMDDAGWTFTTSTSPTDAFVGIGVAIGKVRPVTRSLIHLDGTIGSGVIADDDVFDATDNDFTFELTYTAENLTSTSTILSNTADASSRSFQLDLVNDALTLYLSSDNTTWDIAGGVVIGTITASRFYCEVERIGTEIIYRFNGVEQGRLFCNIALAAGGDWNIGNYASTQYSDGILHAWRFMIGKYRYGSDHAVTALPFADSDTYGAGIVYSSKPALMWNDMAQSPFYGLGATTVGVIDSTDWGDELLDDGVTPRCRTGLTISSPGRVEYYLDILANYANCLWYPDGGDLRIAPDQASTSESPSGLGVVINGIFDTDSDWSKGVGWTIASGIASSDGAQVADSILGQTLVTEANVEYAVEFELNTYTAGNVLVNFDGIEVIANKSSLGTYSVLATATTTSTALEIVADIDFVGSIDSVRVRRSYWLETNWVRGTLTVQGQSERQSPSSVNVKFKKPDDATPNWQTKSAIRTFPEAATGLTPFILTAISLPGTQNLNEAYNKAVIKMQRMFDRIAVSYQTTDTGMYQRIGDVVQLQNSTRGADLRVWVENVKLVEPGRFQIEGIFYSELHFSNSSYGGLFQCDAVYEVMVNIDPTAYWPLFDGPTPLALVGSVKDHSTHGNNIGVFDSDNSFFPEGGEAGYPPVLEECNKTGMRTSNGFGGQPALRDNSADYISQHSSGTLMFIGKEGTGALGRFTLMRWKAKVGPANQQKTVINLLTRNSDLEINLATPTSEFGGGLDADGEGIHVFTGALTVNDPQFIIFRWDFSYVEPGSGIADVRVDAWVNGVKAGEKVWGGKGENVSTDVDAYDGQTDIDGVWNHNAYWDRWISDETIAEIQNSVSRNQSGYTP